MRELNTTTRDEDICEQMDKKMPKTTLEHIECIIKLIEGSGLNNEFFQKAKKSIDHVAEKWDLTANQAVLFAIFIENCDDEQICINNFAQPIGCCLVKVISLIKDIDELEKRRFIRCKRKNHFQSYRVPEDVINALIQDIVYIPESTKNLTTKELFKHINRLFDERRMGEITYDALLKELRAILYDNLSLAFCRQIKEYEEICAGENIFLLLLFFCHQYVNWNIDCFELCILEDFHEDEYICNQIISNLENGQSMLLKHHILEHLDHDWCRHQNYFIISATAKEKLFAELDIYIQQTDNRKSY
ncbi:hypothetical protein LJB94_00125 [Odoribacter sp. OttesenSCG-928-G04]|nr:hypothetical protein [Odoribacter sp. OttesenSCG-928-G04]MDL2331020.1 hypothetical protein [Odoribacter sp. OttesenSCG-928-A06]